MNTKKFTITLETAFFIAVFLFGITGRSYAQCGTASALSPVASATQICSGTTLKLSVQGVQVVNWIYRDNSGSWQNTFSGNQSTYSVTINVSSNTSREYRAIINHSTCNNDTTAGVTVSLQAAGYGNINSLVPLSSSASACSNSNVIVSIPAQYTVKEWLYRDNNSGNWFVYSTGNSTTLNVSGSATTTPLIRSLRAVVAGGSGCSYDTSAAVNLTFNPQSKGNRNDIIPIPTATNVCAGTNTQASVSSLLSLQNWIYRDNNGSWQNSFSGSSINVSTSSITTNTTRDFRVLVNDNDNCRLDTSAMASITIVLNRGNDNNIVPTSTNPIVCSGNTATVAVPNNLSSQVTGWLRRDNGTGNWTLISSTSVTYNDFSTTVSVPTSRSYRALIRNIQSCSIDTTAEVVVNIKPNTNGNNNSLVPLAYSNTVCSGSQATVTFNGNGATVQNWIYRNNNTGNWFSGGSGTSYTDFNTTVTANTQRSYRAVLRDNLNCRIDTTAEVAISIKIKSYSGNTIQIQPVNTNPVICANATSQASITYNGNYTTEKWVYTDGSNWSDVSGSSSNSMFDYNTNVTSTTTRTYKALLRNNETCIIDTTLSTTTIITPRTYGVNNSVTIQPVQNTYCSGASVFQISASNIPNGYSAQNWIYRNNNTGSWIQTSSGTTLYDYSTTVSSTTVRSYRLLIFNSAMCKVDTSVETSITINTRNTGNNNSLIPVTSTTAICNGSNLFANITLNSGQTVARWLWRDNNGAWNIISTTSTSISQSNTYVLTSTTRQIRTIINDNNTCSTDTSAVLSVTINPVTGGTVSSITPSASQTAVCAGNTINVNLGSGSSTTFLRWYYSNNGTQWLEPSVYSQGTSMSDNDTRVTSSTSRRYRYVYYRNQGSCIIDTTQNITVNITPLGGGGMLSKSVSVSNSSICAGGSVTVSVSLASGEQVSRWLYRNNNGPWLVLSTSTSSAVSDNNIRVNTTTTREYRAVLYNTNGCSYDTTQSSSLTVNPLTNGNNPSVTPTAAASSVCGDGTLSINVNPGTGNSLRQWLYNNNNGSWLLLNTNNSTNYNHANTTVPNGVTSRGYRVLLTDAVNCNIDTSASLILTIQPLQTGNHSATPSGNTTVCASATSNNISLSTPSGYTVSKWIYNNNGGAWDDFPFNTSGSTTISDLNLNTANTTNRGYRVIIRNSSTCRIDTSATFSSTIYKNIGGVLTTSVPVALNSTVCFGATSQLSLNVPSGYSVTKWMYSDNGGALKDFTNSTSSSVLNENHTQVSATVSRSYVVILSNSSSCRRDTTAGTSVTINPRNNFGNSTANPTANPTGGICNGGSVQLSINQGAGNTVERWIYSDNNGPWTNILSSNSSSVTHQNTYINATVNRQYRAMINNVTQCRLDTSNAVNVNISMLGYGTDTTMVITSPDTICGGTTANISVGSSPVRKWIYRDNNGAWMDINNSASSSINETNTNVTSTVTRTYAALVFKTAFCRIDTSKLRTVVLKPYSQGNSTVKANIFTDSVCIGTSIVFMSVPTGTVKTWIYRDNFTGIWTSIPFSASTGFNHSLSGLTLNTPRVYRAILTSTGCSEDTTAGDTVVIKAFSKGNNNSVTPTISNATICNGAPAFVSINPGSGNSVIKWIYRNNNTGPWLDYQTGGNSISDYNTYVTTPQTRVYRAILRNNTLCSEDTSALLTLSLLPIGNGNTTTTPTANNSTVCTGSSAIISVNPGSGNSVQRWIYRNGTTGNWIDLAYSGNTVTDNNTITGVTLVRNYRAIIYNPSTCSRDTTPAVSVTITPVTVGVNTSITPTASNSTVCAGGFAQITTTTAGGSVVGWVYNINGSAWMNYGYTTSTSISDYQTSYTSTTTKAYRALIYTSSTCRIDTTNSVTVTISPRTYGNDNSYTFTSPSSACSGSSYNVQISSLGSGNSIARWIYRDNSGAWMNISSSSTAFTESNTNVSSTTTRVYRALIVKGNACTIDTSNACTVTINPVTNGNDNSITPSGPSSVCSGATANVSVSPGSGNTVQRWIYRINNTGAWMVYTYSSTTSFTEYNTSVSSTTSRSYRALIYKSALCKLDTSAEYTLTMSPRTYGNLSATPSAGNSSICTGSSVNISVTISGGTIQSWIYRDNNGAWNTLSYTSSTSITDYNTSVSATTTRQYRALVTSNTGCTIDTTNAATVTVNPRTYGNISNTPSLSSNNVCSGSSVTAGVTVSGSVIGWLYRDNNAGNWINWNIASNNVTDYNTTTSATLIRSYRALVQSSGCSIDTTQQASVTINPIGRGNNTMQPTANTSTVCAGNVAGVNITPGTSTVLGWMYRDNNTGSWTPISFSGSSSYYDYATGVSATTVRSYRALVYTAAACSYDTSLAVSLTINPITKGNLNTLTPTALNGTVCSGEPAFISVSTPLQVLYWIYRTDGGAWQVYNSGSTSYSDYATSTTAQQIREYRAIVRNTSNCSDDTTLSVAVTLKPYSNGNSTATPTVNQNMICSGNSISASIGGNVLYWIYRNNNGTWLTASGGNTLIQNNTSVGQVTLRSIRAILINTSSCSYDTSAQVDVTINPNSTGNVSLQPATEDVTICSNNPAVVKVNGYIGNVVRWIYRDNSGQWNNISFSAVDSFIHNATTVTALTTREYRAILYTGCSTDTTLAIAVTIDVFPVTPLVSQSGDTLICSIASGVTYKWIRNGLDIPGANAQKYVPTQSGNYVVEVGNSNDCKTASVPFNYVKSSVASMQLLDVVVYPNPTHSGEIHINFTPVTSSIRITVMNAMGQLVQQKQVEATDKLTLDLSAFAQGLYFIHLEADGKQATKQVLFR
jgi:hypothetical protein